MNPRHLIPRRFLAIVGLLSLLAVVSGMLAAAYADGINGTANGPVGLFVNGSTEALHITTGGNVGIGTSAAQSLLHVQAGEVQVGSSGATCAANTGGAVRFSGTSLYYCNNSAWTALATAGGGSAISALTAATATNSFDNGTYAQTWTWNSLAGNAALSLSSTSTAAASNAQQMLNISLSGANGTSAQTTYGEYITNTHTGTTSTNVGLYASASGGTNNYAAIYAAGSVGIGTVNPQSLLHIQAGEVQVGSSGASCSSNNAGAMRYSGGTMSYCNGSAWTFFNRCPLQEDIAVAVAGSNSVYGLSAFASGGYIYAAMNSDGLFAYTFNGTTFTKQATKTASSGGEQDVYVQGSNIFTAENSSGIRAFTFSGSAFTQTGSYSTSMNAKTIYSNGTNIFVVNATRA